MATNHDQLHRLPCEGPWLRRLARRLGGQDADDLVQDTWLAALQHPPDHSRPAGPWLHRVLQNFAGMAGRKKLHREMFESVQRMDEADHNHGDAHVAFERRQLQHELGWLLSELEEPYRAAVVARYVLEQTLEDMAATMKIPSGTQRKISHRPVRPNPRSVRTRSLRQSDQSSQA